MKTSPVTYQITHGHGSDALLPSGYVRFSRAGVEVCMYGTFGLAGRAARTRADDPDLADAMLIARDEAIDLGLIRG